MSRYRNTRNTALVASFDRSGAAYASTDPADLRPMRTGKKSDLFSRVRGTAAEVEQAEALIRAKRVQALIADFGPNDRVRDMVGTL